MDEFGTEAQPPPPPTGLTEHPPPKEEEVEGRWRAPAKMAFPEVPCGEVMGNKSFLLGVAWKYTEGSYQYNCRGNLTDWGFYVLLWVCQ